MKGKIVTHVNIVNMTTMKILLTLRNDHEQPECAFHLQFSAFLMPYSHCAGKLIGCPFQSVILQSEAINFPMQHESIILMMMLVTGPYGHSAVRDLPGNLSNYALAKHLWDVTNWQRKDSSLPKKMV